MNRKINLYILLAITFLFASCEAESESHIVADEKPNWKIEQSVQDKDEAPNWTTHNDHLYQSSMTVIFSIQEGVDCTEQDQIGAFIGDECRAVGTQEDVNGKTMYFLHIKGEESENKEVIFKYYNANLKKIYTAKKKILFEKDANYGTVNQALIFDIYNDYQVFISTNAVQFPAQLEDEIAVFSENKCIGLGELIATNTQQNTYKIAFQSLYDAKTFYLKYYSKSHSMIYESKEHYSFGENNTLGTEEKPLEVDWLNL